MYRQSAFWTRNVRRLKATGQAHPANNWPCYHTELFTFTVGTRVVGIIGCAVGAPFAVLIAEELFASGCDLLISITSAGQITPAGQLPYFVVIDRALRDEEQVITTLCPQNTAKQTRI